MELNACIATATHQPEGSGLATALGVCPKSGEKLTLLRKWALTAVSRFSFRADGAVGDQGIDDVVPDDLEHGHMFVAKFESYARSGDHASLV